MEDSFDRERAVERHSEIIREAERIRDGLSKDVINYYYENPTTEDEERTKNAGIRKYLIIAEERIRDLLNNKL
jgi:hypothetical protein